MDTQNIMPPKQISKVVVTYLDGSEESFDVPETQGFVRKSLTYEPVREAQGILKWGKAINMHEICWYT